MKEKIYEFIQSEGSVTSVYRIKQKFTELSNYRIHKICDQLVSENLIGKQKFTNYWTFFSL